MQNSGPRQRSAILSDLARLRQRLGGWTAAGLPPEHRDGDVSHPPLPADFYAIKNRIQALKRELMLLP